MRGGPDKGRVSTAVPVALTIAGSDSGGGAGIQADLKTFAAHGVYGVSALTAVTAQNTLGVTGVQEIRPEIVTAQIDAVAEDLAPLAAKTGMLSSAEIILAVVGSLERLACPVIVDPVMVAKSGHRLLRDDAVAAVREELLPRAALLTPNLPEAADLTGRPVEDEAGMRAAGERLLALGAGAVLVKGGHLERDEVVDLLFADGEIHEFRSPRIHTRSTHGTGCTLSAAVTARLARGATLRAAVAGARDYLRRAMERAAPLGAGHGPLGHLPGGLVGN